MSDPTAPAENTAAPRLAIDGGTPVRTAPLPAWPHFAEDEISAVSAVLRSGHVNYWTGTQGRDFEAAFAAFTGRKHAIALGNGTAALELALWVAGIGPGDEVVVPARTFIATASSVVMRGARPVCADIDRDSGNVTADTIRAALSPKTKAVIVVHLGGWPCDMGPIMDLATTHGLTIIENCAQALGASYRGRPVGSFGHLAAFSFCQDKIMTTGGEGGMLVTDHEAMFELAWSLKDHGKSFAEAYAGTRTPGAGFRWQVERFGTNLRMTEMQAAVGLVALGKVPGWVARRREFAGRLNEAFSELPALRLTLPAEEFGHAYYKYYAFVRPEALASGWTRDRVVDSIAAEGIPCFVGSCPEIYLERAFEGLRPTERLPVAKELGETSVMLQVHPTLSDEDVGDMIAAVGKVMRVAGR